MKYPHKPHRLWKESVVLQAEEPLIVANQDVVVVEGDGKTWMTKGLAICLFSLEDWFNSIILFDQEKQLTHYYVNIASPYSFDSDQMILTYIDYDLDFIISPSFEYDIVDQTEYRKNKVRFSYPDEIDKKVCLAMKSVIDRIHQREDPYNRAFVDYWLRSYLSIQKELN
jgi:protein associated with RNAse G/E